MGLFELMLLARELAVGRFDGFRGEHQLRGDDEVEVGSGRVAIASGLSTLQTGAWDAFSLP